MVEESLLDGLIYHGPGGCPKCGGPLIVADSEISIMDLKQDGTPYTEETTIRCEAICTHCGNRIKMSRWGGKYIPYNPTAIFIKLMDLKRRCKERSDEKKKEENPLSV